MVSSQDQSVFSAGAVDLKNLLPDSISCPLIPGVIQIGLLRCPDLDPAAMERIKVVGPGNMTVEGNRIELG